MTTTCRFSACKWTGSVDEIFTHCETYHPRYIRDHKKANYYDFVFDDLNKEAFLLTGPSGLYWFCMDPHNYEDKLKRSIFHIGDSEPIEYTMKIGLIRDGHAHYLGPFTSNNEGADEIYNLEFSFASLEHINVEMPSRKIRIYIGEYDDSEDRYNPESDDLVWTEEDEALNRLCVEKFTCLICYEFIRRDARFCENKHYVCLDCFDEMLKRQRLRCPMCRQDYPYDCHNPELERFLRMVKFPDRKEESGRRKCCDGSEEPSGSSKRMHLE